jgi:GNAT superfamily N-acetyltransferase
MSGLLHPADRRDLAWLWPAVRAAQLFDDIHELEAHWAEAPWRVRVNARGEAAVLVRWRAHLDILAIKGMWCSERRVPLILEDVRAVAREQGFGSVLSPLLPEEAAEPYLETGMHVVQEIVVMRMLLRSRHKLISAEDTGAVELRTGTLADVPAVTAVNAAAFEEFWRYDPQMIAGYTARERLGLAVQRGEVVGYTLCTARREDGSLGRLAVRPDVQGRGIGALLVEDALAFLEREGAVRVTLCTQTDNVRSRRLYRQAGFEEVPGKLLGLLTDQL